MTKYITIKLTEDQVGAIDALLIDEIERIETDPHKNFKGSVWQDDDKPFYIRLRTKLAKAKTS